MKMSKQEHKVIWSSHHILMDGWCSSIIINDLFAIYSTLRNQQEINLKKPASYGEYMKWLKKQPENKA
ncbi:condensation domain-containing protein, partial [Arthrobacter sp. SIMBA_036]|uniref:condensation domain-containing protein n=1 Tax=Arthrobacter sp. SIMBA_036 TaxID=3085778 RepID=UPI00397858AF